VTQQAPAARAEAEDPPRVRLTSTGWAILRSLHVEACRQCRFAGGCVPPCAEGKSLAAGQHAAELVEQGGAALAIIVEAEQQERPPPPDG